MVGQVSVILAVSGLIHSPELLVEKIWTVELLLFIQLRSFLPFVTLVTLLASDNSWQCLRT